MREILREPLLHFLLLGAAVFALFELLDDGPRPVAESAVVVTEADARRLVAEFEAVWRRQPTVEELETVIDQYVREEVYVREALALGLDRDDAVIRRRLQMKMEFLTETGAEAVAPDDEALAAHLESHPERFAEPALVTFEQVTLAEAVPAEDLPLIEIRLNEGGDPQDYAQATLLPRGLRAAPR